MIITKTYKPLKLMKKLLSLLLLALALNATAQTPVKKCGQLQVIGTQLCDQNGKPVVLRGVSFGWHNIWPRNGMPRWYA